MTRTTQELNAVHDNSHTCSGCGAGLDPGDRECPYCGHSVVSQTQDSMRIDSSSDRAYRLGPEQGKVTFGDGEHGRTPSTSSDGMSATYRAGGGSAGAVRGQAVTEIPEIDELHAGKLRAAGVDDIETFSETDDSKLERILGVSKKEVRRMKKSARRLRKMKHWFRR